MLKATDRYVPVRWSDAALALDRVSLIYRDRPTTSVDDLLPLLRTATQGFHRPDRDYRDGHGSPRVRLHQFALAVLSDAAGGVHGTHLVDCLRGAKRRGELTALLDRAAGIAREWHIWSENQPPIPVLPSEVRT